jgi:hypothetical protein
MARTKTRRGRPPKAPEDRRTVLIRVLATVEQADELREAAEEAGLPLSSWLLQLGLRTARRAK